MCLEQKKCSSTLISKQIHSHTHTHTHTPDRIQKWKCFVWYKVLIEWKQNANGKKWDDDGGMCIACSRFPFPQSFTLTRTLSFALIFSSVPGKKLLLSSIYLEEQSEFDWHWLCQKRLLVSGPVSCIIYITYTPVYLLRIMNKME